MPKRRTSESAAVSTTWSMPVEKADTTGVRVDPFAEIGTTGLKRWGGVLTEEWLPDLKGTKEAKVYREMRDNSPIVGAMLMAIEQMMHRTSIRVEPAGTSDTDRRAAELVRTALDDMSNTWADTLSEILSMLVYGWSWVEIVYKRREGSDGGDASRRSAHRDGMIGWRKLALRSQDTLDRFVFDREGGVQAMVQRDPLASTLYTLPIEKSALFRTRPDKGNPKGRSLLRNAYIPYYFIKRVQAIEGIGIERDLAGLPVALVPPELLTAAAGTTESAILDTIKTLVTNIRRDEQEGAVFPLAYDGNGNVTYKLELLSTGGARQFDTGRVIERHERRVAMCVLADFIMLGHEKVGSFALASSKTDVFALALAGWLDSILAVLNRHVIPRLLALNGLPVDKPPTLVHGDVESPDLAELGAYVQSLAGSGMLLFPSPDGQLERTLLQAANLPATAYGEGAIGKRNVEWLGVMLEAARELRDTVRALRTGG